MMKIDNRLSTALAAMATVVDAYHVLEPSIYDAWAELPQNRYSKGGMSVRVEIEYV